MVGSAEHLLRFFARRGSDLPPASPGSWRDHAIQCQTRPDPSVNIFSGIPDSSSSPNAGRGASQPSTLNGESQATTIPHVTRRGHISLHALRPETTPYATLAAVMP